jgi:hypothetical protein
MSGEGSSEGPKICCPVCGKEITHLWHREVIVESGRVDFDEERGLDWWLYEGEPYETYRKEFCCPKCDAKLFSYESEAEDFAKGYIGTTPEFLEDEPRIVKKLRELLAKCREVEGLAEKLERLAGEYKDRAKILEGFPYLGLWLSRGEGCDVIMVSGEGSTLMVSDKATSFFKTEKGEGLEALKMRLEKVEEYVDEKIKELEGVASAIKAILATANLLS